MRLSKSKKPVILAGAGILHAKASAELTAFAEKHQIPVVNHTYLDLEAFPADQSPLLRNGWNARNICSKHGIYECDLLINIGARFDDRLNR